MSLARLLILTVAILGTTHAWYTCDDLKFCSDIRNGENSASFTLSDVKVNGVVTGRLINDQTLKEYNFKFSALLKGSYRLTVQNIENPRYTPEKDSLDGVPEEDTLIAISNSSDMLVLRSSDASLLVNLYLKPFKLEVLRDGVVITEVNKGNRLVINDEEDDASIALDISFPLANSAYGIPQHGESLSLPSTGPGGLSPYRLFNVDNPAYLTHARESLYGAIPVLYGVSTSITSGVFWMNGAQTFVDVTNEGFGVDSLFISESGALELFLLPGPTLRESVRQYTKLTGVAGFPQYFVLGYHQSRYSYMTQEDVLTVVDEFDNHNFPVDVIWLDIDYSEGYKYFTWNYSAFPDPVGMQNYVASTGRKMVAISDPHIKVEKGYFVYDQGIANGYFVKNPDGSVYEGDCWPGLSSYIDYFNPAAQEWYADLYSLENFANSTLNLYIWNDMNEPSVFRDEDDKTMPPKSVQYGGLLHRDVHNMYGFKQTQATHAGLLKRDPNRRPYILSRSHFAGSQRYTSIWTGDNEATWEHLRISIPMILTESLVGMVLCGADVGGFVGNVTDELHQRWYQTGAWYPFFRGHSDVHTVRREPYLYPEEIQDRIRDALHVRYRHIPYWYLLFFEHQLTGDPVVRPLSYHYPEDAKSLHIDEQWLIGEDIMAAPVLYEAAERVRTYFPGAKDQYWFDSSKSLVYRGGETHAISVDLDSMPYYYRSGSIIFTVEDEVSSTEQQRNSGLTMHIFLGANGEARGRFFMDDWESFQYKDKVFNYYEFSYGELGLIAQQLDQDASYERGLRIDAIFLYEVQGSFVKGVARVQQRVLNKEKVIWKH